MRYKEMLRKKYYEILYRLKRLKKRTLYCIGIGILFSIFSFFANRKSIYVNPYEIERSSYGTQKTPYHIVLDAENLAKNMEFNVAVSPRKYLKDEADNMFIKKMDDLMTLMLNGNEDYMHISNKLKFLSDLGDGIKATYSFTPSKRFENKISTLSSIATSSILATNSDASDFKYFVDYQGLIDGSGNVKNEDFKINEVCTGYIEIQLSTDIKEKDTPYKSEKYIIPVKIISKKLTPIESFKVSFKKQVEISDNDTVDENSILLPRVINDFKIKYKEKLDLTFIFMLLLGIVMAILLEARDKEKIKDEIKRKKRLLEIDFSQIISKLLLFVNSGMTIRNSMIKIADQYYEKKTSFENKNYGKKVKFESRVAYEELLIVKNKLLSGYSEIKAYEEMAKNINLRTYTRFLNILIQSIKNGNKELKNILNMEVQDALYERKQHAKKLGEEAATKLVLPLMIMLAVIMIVIMVPAFMGM